MKGGDTCTLTPRTRAEFQKEWQALQKILEETLEKKLEVERAFEFYYRYCFNNPQNLSNERAIIVGQFAKAYGIALPQAEGLFDALQNELSLHIDSQSLSIEQFNVFVEKYLEPEDTQYISYAPDAPDAPYAPHASIVSGLCVCNAHKRNLNQEKQDDSQSSFYHVNQDAETRAGNHIATGG